MDKNAIIVGLALLVIGAGGGYVVTKQTSDDCPHADSMMGGMMGEMMMGSGASGHGMGGAMDAMTADLQGKSGDEFDKAFLSQMILHHEGAVQMAQAALLRAKHQEIRDMAEDIISAQTSEIRQMEAWSKDWYNR